MKAISIVSLASLSKSSEPSEFTPYIEAALAMPRGQAVHVSIENRSALYNSLIGCLVRRRLNDKLRVKRSGDQVYLVHREAVEAA